MKITTLVEDTSKIAELRCEHGLSWYIETKKHKMLFDVGQSDLFSENAKKLGIDLSDIDIVIISHAHYDHGGGLKKFLEINKKAKLFFNKSSFENYYALRPNGNIVYIGLDKDLLDRERMIFVDNYLKIDDELELFSGINGREYFSNANKVLFMEKNGRKVQDDFTHEQNLIINENDKNTLIAGCAHNGIINIIKKYSEIKGKEADNIIGGFHLYNPSSRVSEKPELVKEIAKVLLKYNTYYYTCHCTGIEAYEQLKETMKNRINYLDTGSRIEL